MNQIKILELDELIDHRNAMIYELMFLERRDDASNNLVKDFNVDQLAINFQPFCTANNLPIYNKSSLSPMQSPKQPSTPIQQPSTPIQQQPSTPIQSPKSVEPTTTTTTTTSTTTIQPQTKRLRTNSTEPSTTPLQPPPTITIPIPMDTPAIPIQEIIMEETKPLLLPPSVFAKIPQMNQDGLARAAEDAHTMRRIHELQSAGVWRRKLLHKLPEPPRPKVHWDHLLEEMAIVGEDFARLRRLKTRVRRTLVKEVDKFHMRFQHNEERAAREEEARKKRVAANIAKEVKRFWSQIGKLVDYKEKLATESARKVERDKQLDLIVGRTEQYSTMVAQDMQSTTTSPLATKPTLQDILRDPVHLDTLEGSDDSEYSPSSDEDSDDIPEDDEDDEEEIEDMEALKRESEMSLDDLLAAELATHDNDEDDEAAEEGIDAIVKSKQMAQPTGTTLKTTRVKTRVPFLIKHPLREYQHIGLDWLSSLYDKQLNGVLADEMGLGKTIQTISLLAYLAVERGIWGPHLVVVPSSVLFNWEMEFKRWCPAFKLLTYHGAQKDRRLLRKGWSKANAFHVCITSYSTIVTDHTIFKRKKWHYMVLDEAHSIKNFKSQRWQTLLTFNATRRLLLTGTPLQNNLMELWSLLHFLMPAIFASHAEFNAWFATPVTGAIEGGDVVDESIVTRLHAVLRPFLLRRLKKDVEKQMPQKYTHIVTCALSRRQRYLYEEFMSAADTQATLHSGNFFSIINVLMQLRKVCNHPDLFETRPIVSPLDTPTIYYETTSLVTELLDDSPARTINLDLLNLDLLDYEGPRSLRLMDTNTITELMPSDNRIREIPHSLSFKVPLGASTSSLAASTSTLIPTSCLDIYQSMRQEVVANRQRESLDRIIMLKRRSYHKPLYGRDLVSAVTILDPVADIHTIASQPRNLFDFSSLIADAVKTVDQRELEMRPFIERFVFLIPRTRAPPIRLVASHASPSKVLSEALFETRVLSLLAPAVAPLREAFKRTQLFFPDRRLVQFDCGKLQRLAKLLQTLKTGGHRALIFTQMTRMLDILEVFLNLHGYTYVRLDGSTKVDRRQLLTERFNTDQRIFLFILSTRSGGLGLNLTGADTVIFYDTDWNPSMDAQAQDRCHRIGQTREVHIYRLITQYTIEENILKKSNQKRQLDDVVIQGGEFTTDFFKNLDLNQVLGTSGIPVHQSASSSLKLTQQEWESAAEKAEDDQDVVALKQAQKEQASEFQEFDENDSDKATGSTSTTPPIDGSIAMAAELKAQQDLVHDFLNPIQNYGRGSNFSLALGSGANSTTITTTTNNIDAEADKEILFFELSGISNDEFQSSLILFGDLLECLTEPDNEQWYLAPMQEPLPENLFEQVLKDQDEYYHQHYHYLYPPSPPLISFESFVRPIRSRLKRGKVIKQTAQQYIYSKQFTKEKEKEKRLLIKKKKEKDKREKLRLEEERKAKEKKEVKKSSSSKEKTHNGSSSRKDDHKKSGGSSSSTKAQLKPDDIIMTQADEFEELAENVEMMLKNNPENTPGGDEAGSTDSSAGMPASSGGSSKSKRTKSGSSGGGLFGSRPLLRKSSKGTIDVSGVTGLNMGDEIATNDLLAGPPWYPQEDAIILEAVRTYGQNWELVAHLVRASPFEQIVRFQRSRLQCADRYKVLFSKEALGDNNKKGAVDAATSHEGPFPYTLLDNIRRAVQQNKLICRQGTVSQIENKVGIHISHTNALTTVPINQRTPTEFAWKSTANAPLPIVATETPPPPSKPASKRAKKEPSAPKGKKAKAAAAAAAAAAASIPAVTTTAPPPISINPPTIISPTLVTQPSIQAQIQSQIQANLSQQHQHQQLQPQPPPHL
eukprot:gene5747-6651_t